MTSAIAPSTDTPGSDHGSPPGGSESQTGSDSIIPSNGSPSGSGTDNSAPPSGPPSESEELRRAHLRAAFGNLTPEERADLFLQFGGTLPTAPQSSSSPSLPSSRTQASVSSEPSSILFSDEGDAQISEDLDGHIFNFQYHRSLRDLALYKYHIPLSVFLSSSIRTLFLDLASIPTISTKGVGGVAKHTVINTAHFPDEATLDVADWTEAWGNMLVFIEENSTPSYYQRQLDHYNWMRRRQSFKESFAAILRFDILIRKEYRASPAAFSLQVYKDKYYAIERAIMAEELAALKAATSTSSSRSPSISSGRNPSSSRPASKGPPFQKGSGSTSGPPICLICAREGHRFSNCTNPSLVSGQPCFAAFVDGKFVVASSLKPLCISWNLFGSTRCRASHPTHFCSFCGEPSHHACSRSCL